MYNNPLHKSFSKRSNKQALKSCKKLTVFEFYKVMVYCLQRQMVMFMKKLKFADLPPTFRAWRHQNKHLMVLLICRKCPDVLYKIFLKNSCGNSHWYISCYTREFRASPRRYCPHSRHPVGWLRAGAAHVGRFGLVQQQQPEPRHLASSPDTAPPTVQPSCGGRRSVPAQSSKTDKLKK